MRSSTSLRLPLLLTALGAVLAAGLGAAAQDAAQRVSERLRALRAEAESLAEESRTLLVQLRQLELERDMKVEERRQAEAALAKVNKDIDLAAAQLGTLEAARDRQVPGLASRMRALYTLGSGGYARLLLSVDDPREMGRAYRVVTALAHLDRERVRAHESTLESLRAVIGDLERQRADAQGLQRAAADAARAASRAVESRNRLMARIDAERDLNAQLVGELQAAQAELSRTVLSLTSGTMAVPLAPFRGSLDWPATGAVTGRFGGTSPGGPRQGVEIAAGDGTVVRAVHPGTVAHAGPFTGYGNLVILDHGARAYTLYGYLGAISVSKGAPMAAGARLGQAGFGPTGQEGVYFELRIDGRAVDPLQWLKPRP